MRRAEIVAEARSWLGTPFRHQGRLKGVGCDCIGLVVGVGRRFGLEPEDPADYARLPDGRRLRAGLAANLAEVSADAARPGDVVLLRIRRDPQHVAILAPAEMMIHAFSAVGRVVATRLDGRWRRRLVAAYRFPGVEED